MTLADATERIHRWSEAFLPAEMQNIPFAIAHLHEEASEVFKAYRNNDMERRLVHHHVLAETYNPKPDGFLSEIADVILMAAKIAKLAGFTGADVEAAVEEKLVYQENRLVIRNRFRP